MAEITVNHKTENEVQLS